MYKCVCIRGYTGGRGGLQSKFGGLGAGKEHIPLMESTGLNILDLEELRKVQGAGAVIVLY